MTDVYRTCHGLDSLECSRRWPTPVFYRKGGRNSNAVLSNPMRGLWGTFVVTAKGTVFNEDLHNAIIWQEGRYAVIKHVNEKQGGTTVSKVTGASNAVPEKPMRGLCVT